MILVRTADQKPEKCIKLLSAVAVDGSTHRPHYREEEQTLKPTGHLRRAGQGIMLQRTFFATPFRTLHSNSVMKKIKLLGSMGCVGLGTVIETVMETSE